ncbi:putative leucine aminopeptidase 1 [Cladochytrium replicatum]|nr:putative leucine aminopeptidase 1 [Cladochytrium replicatum]
MKFSIALVVATSLYAASSVTACAGSSSGVNRRAELIRRANSVPVLPPTVERLPTSLDSLLGSSGGREALKSKFATGLHLIQLAGNQKVWMTEDQILTELIQKHVRFFDLTDQPLDVVADNLRVVNSADQTFAATAIPTTLTQKTLVNSLIPKISKANLNSTLTTLSNFYNRYYTSTYGVQSAQWLFDQASTIANSTAGKTVKASVKKFTHTWAQFSVIATIPGSSAEKVIVGAHQDSINQSNTAGRAPGADDDGTGSVTILELFRILVEAGFVPTKTLEFHWYAAEEVGLRGSQAIANNYKSASAKVAGMLQLDMTGYRPTAPGVIGLVTDYVSAPLNTFLKLLIDNYATIGRTEFKCGYACSDHASWYQSSFPSVCPFEATIGTDNPNIHTANDVIKNLVNFDHMVQFARISLGFLVELGSSA